MRLYHVSEGKANIPLNITLCGDITITLYHARNSIAGMGKPQGIKVCQLQFHSGFIPEEETLLSFNRSELDDVPEIELVPNNFNMSLSVFVGDDERGPTSKPPWLSQTQHRERDPKILFASQLEYEENVDNFSKLLIYRLLLSYFHVFFYKKFLVSKPSTNNNENNNSASHIPPPRPAPPKMPEHSHPADVAENKEEPMFKDETETDTVNTVEFDFLNLNEKPPEIPKIQKVKEPSFDLLGGFDSNFSDPVPDLLESAMNKPTVPPVVIESKSNNLDDIFGSLPQNVAPTPTIAPSKSSNDLSGLDFNFSGASGSKSHENPKNKDPFADLTQTMHTDFSATSSKSTQNPFNPMQSFSTNASPRNNPSTPIHQMKSPNDSQRPDYSRSNFQDPSSSQTPQKNKPADIFGDILGQQGYSFGKINQGPRSINEMRKVELAQTMDPEKLKVSDWVLILQIICILVK